MNMAIVEELISSNDIKNNETMTNDKVVASYVLSRYLLLFCFILSSKRNAATVLADQKYWIYFLRFLSSREKIERD